jgi:hypothetical protein
MARPSSRLNCNPFRTVSARASLSQNEIPIATNRCHPLIFSCCDLWPEPSVMTSMTTKIHDFPKFLVPNKICPQKHNSIPHLSSSSITLISLQPILLSKINRGGANRQGQDELLSRIRMDPIILGLSIPRWSNCHVGSLGSRRTSTIPTHRGLNSIHI